MNIYFLEGSETVSIDAARSGALLESMLSAMSPKKRVLLVPPDFTRLHSCAGEITKILYDRLCPEAEVVILPASGTHRAMTSNEIKTMFGEIPLSVFREHHWRENSVVLGEVPKEFIQEVSGGKLDFAIPCQMNRLLVEEQWDQIISIGQVVPHEVVGIANYNKNILIGTGGPETINKTHFLGAVCGMETMMGRSETPVRKVLDYMQQNFCANLPVTYVLTCRGQDDEGRLVTRGLFAGEAKSCFRRAAALCQSVNITLLDAPLRKIVVWLDAEEFRSTWLGNKAVYRTRMAIADGGELVVLAPGVNVFGEDESIDTLIRRYGYRGTEQTLASVRNNSDLASNLSAAAHLIHGSSEGRFTITYCPGREGLGGDLTREEVEDAGFAFADLEPMLKRYDPSALTDGFNRLSDGEEVYFVSNPGLGLWALKSQFSVNMS